MKKLMNKKSACIGVLVLLLALVLVKCSAPMCKALIPGIMDLAIIACEISAADMDEKELGGMTPQEWCDIAKNVKPYIEDLAEQNIDSCVADAGMGKE